MIISPYQFIGDYVVDGKRISYLETRELGQGGPLLGLITIDEAPVADQGKKAEFGGPFIIDQGYLIAPMIKGFEFVLVKVEIKSGSIVAKSSQRERLILIKSIENNKVYYYNDLDNSNLRFYAF